MNINEWSLDTSDTNQKMLVELEIDDPRVKEMYKEFVEDFDPSPQYAYDGYASLPDFDSWYHFIYLDL